VNIGGIRLASKAGESIGTAQMPTALADRKLEVGTSFENETAPPPDHFVEREGLRFAGTHLIIDLWQACRLDDVEEVETALRMSAEAAGASLLKLELHRFLPSGGVTGVALLAESHISIHTWPERSYAAVDVFMCGRADPHKAVEVLRQAFEPATLILMEHKRGLIS
jgi:S-adenosylmethionine decarboxylase